MNPAPRGATAAFVGLTAAAALALLVSAGVPVDPSATLLLWFAACLVGEAFWIRTPTNRGTTSMALTVDLAAIFTLTPAASLLLIALTTVLAGIYPHRRPWYKVLFNASQSTLAAGAAVAVLALVSRGPHPGSLLYLGMTWLPLFAAGVVFYVVNSGLVSAAIALASGTALWKAWRENYGYGFEVWCTIAQISLSGFVLAAYQFMGPFSVLGLLPVIGVLWWSSARESRARAGTAAETDDPDRLKLAG